MKNCKDQFAAQIGLDWGDKKHVYCLRVSGEKRIEPACLEQSPEAISDWVAGLRQRFGRGKVAIFLEQSRGALINALMCHENLVLFPINPKSLARFRSALYPSGSKDDPQDAQLALDRSTHPTEPATDQHSQGLFSPSVSAAGRESFQSSGHRFLEKVACFAPHPSSSDSDRPFLLLRAQ
jgi:hypothetical protein